MQTGSLIIQGGPTHSRQHHARHHRAAPTQVGPAPSGRLHLGNLPSQHHDSTATSISVDFRLSRAERPLAFRNGLEQAYPAGIGGPHNRRSVHPVISSLTALPASLPMPTGEDREIALKPLPRDVENVADDPSLHNPLARQERLSTGWFGVSTLRFLGAFETIFFALLALLYSIVLYRVNACLYRPVRKSQYWTKSCVSICASATLTIHCI